MDSVAGVRSRSPPDWSAACIGRAEARHRATGRGDLGRPDGDAVEVLRDLVAIYDAGRREPLPLPVKTSYAWASARHEGDDPERSGGPWKSIATPGGTSAGPRPGLGQGRRCREALMAPPRAGRGVHGEKNRLGAYACRLWLPMLRARRMPW